MFKSFKKFTGLFLALLLVAVVLLPDCRVSAEDYTFSRYGFHFVITKEADSSNSGTLSVCGLATGFDETDIEIPSTLDYGGRIYDVTELSDRLFYGRPILTVKLPETIERIGKYAFAGCYRLTSVNIPSGCKLIDDGAFYYCSSLSEVDWTSDYGLERIGAAAFAYSAVTLAETYPAVTLDPYCFYGCENLAKINIGKSVESIGELAFSACGNVEKLIISSQNGHFAAYDGAIYTADYKTLLFAGAAKGAVKVHEDCEAIADYAFEGNTRVTSVALSDSVKTLGEGAFLSATSLKSVNLAKVTEIGAFAFRACESLTGITIPKTVEKIGTNPFAYCSAMTSLSVASGNKNYTSKNNRLLSKDKTLLIAAPVSSGKEIVPSYVTTIGEWAYQGNTAIKSLELKKSLKTVLCGAFYDCSSLASVNIASRKIDFSASVSTESGAECRIFFGTDPHIRFTLPYSAKAGEEGSIEYYIREQSPAGAYLTSK